MSITFRQLDSFEVMTEATTTLLKKHMQLEDNMPHAIMLPDGRTPRPVYQGIAADPFRTSSTLYVLLSDERMVPESSPVRLLRRSQCWGFPRQGY